MKTIPVIKTLTGAVFILTVAMNSWSYSLGADEVRATQSRQLANLAIDCGGSQVTSLSKARVSSLLFSADSCGLIGKGAAKTKNAALARFDAGWVLALPTAADDFANDAAVPNSAAPNANASVAGGDLVKDIAQNTQFWAVLHDRLSHEWTLLRVDALLPAAGRNAGNSAPAENGGGSSTAVPEPGSVTLLAAGLFGLLLTRRYANRGDDV